MANSEPQLQADISSLSPGHYSHQLNTPQTPPFLPAIQRNSLGFSRLSATGRNSVVDKENSLAHASAIFHNLHVPNRQMASVALDQHPVLSPRKQNLRAFSPRKQTVENQALSFSPKRARQPPRAWERRPATPYVSRNEGQKIWKRIPLEDMGLERNPEAVESRRIREAKEDYMRAVKKLKVDRKESQNGENTKVDNATGFWATRLEEDSIEKNGTPRQKRTPHPRNEQSNIHQYEEEESENSKKLEENVPTDLVLEALESSASNEPQTLTELDYQSEIKANGTSTEDVNGKEEANGSPKPEDVYEQSYSRDTKSHCHSLNDTGMEARFEEGIVDMEALLSKESDRTGERPFSEPLASETDKNISPSRSQPDLVGEDQKEIQANDRQSHDSLPCNIESAAVVVSPQSEPNLFDRNPLVIDDSDHNRLPSEVTLDHAETASDDLFDLSTPAALQDPVSSECRSEDTRQTEVVLDVNAVPMAKTPTNNPSTTTKPHMVFQAAEEEEDTAFLADFLLRAKASKAAREAAVPQQAPDKVPGLANTSPPISPHKDESTNTDDDDEIEDLDLPCHRARQSTEPLHQTVEISITSPLRRSSRNMNNKTSRLQSLPPVPQFGPVLPSQNVALPNTIQLKRATGNEFIFRGKPQQTVQMMTRTNTKRNQGNAVHVERRLQQLNNGTTNETISVSVGGEDNQLSSTNETSSSPGKKRKRNKESEDRPSKKTKKNVKWHEDLVSYREPTPQPEQVPSASDDFAAIEAAAQTEALQSMTDSFCINEPCSRSQEPRVIEQELPRGKDGDLSKLKVRKLRKVNVGNVNGTPAPKTRTRGRFQSQEPAEVLSEVVSLNTGGKASAGISSLKAKIPVSSSTGSAIPLPATTIVRNTTKDKVKPGSTSTAGIANEKADLSLERKLDGRRRLRARV